MANDIRFDNLPANWNSFDLKGYFENILSDYQHKIDGYRKVFEENDGKKKVLYHDGLNVRVLTFLHTSDANTLSKGYKEYWFDNVGTVIEKVLESYT
jgi:hypothetical protein